MKIVLDVKDNKVAFLMELLNNFSFVKKVEPQENESKEETIKNITQGFRDLKLYKEGKLKTTPAKDFLNEL